MIETKICPNCNKEYVGHSALSRKDNKTYICDICGMKEALEAMVRWEGGNKNTKINKGYITNNGIRYVGNT